jgi:kumamolisin
MTHQEWEARHGADPADIKKVQEYAAQCGLKVEATSIAERRVLLSGSVSAFSKAFNVNLRDYDIKGGRFRGRSGPICVPKSLDGIVTGVFGLSDEPFAEPRYCRTQPFAHATATLPRGFTPIEVARHYNFPTNLDGTGQTIGIIELGGGFRQEELDVYFKKLGVSPPKVKVFEFVGGGRNNPGTNPLDPGNQDLEVALDIEVVGAVAPGAQIVVYFAPTTEDQSFLDVMTAAVQDSENKPSVISISWGGPEAAATNQFQQNFDQVLQAAAHLGITVCVATGDHTLRREIMATTRPDPAGIRALVFGYRMGSACSRHFRHSQREPHLFQKMLHERKPVPCLPPALTASLSRCYEIIFKQRGL